MFFTSDNGGWKIKQIAGGSAGLLRGAKEVRFAIPRGVSPPRRSPTPRTPHSQTTWEGGVREPAIVRWPGKIMPRITPTVAATYDIFPTVLSLAGISQPADRIIDGRDLSPVLFSGAPTQHDCLFIYKGTPGLRCPASHPNCPGLWAVRCGVRRV